MDAADTPATGPFPPSLGMHVFAVAVEVAGQRPALPQVQGCKPCRSTPSLRTTDVPLMRPARGWPLAVRV
ncbi:hypothetical protein G6F59_017693 [Rhizopus arrhizus]|nr:hypothetical protein G6F59_017693 [Rhizopus arrhizus]